MQFRTRDLTAAAIFLALGLLIPYLFHVTGVPGNVFLPMHIPVLLGGFILGRPFGLILGFSTPLLNALLSGMPPLYPTAISMAFELAAYGLVAGYLYKDRKFNVFISLIAAMLLGRIVAGVANFCLLGMAGQNYGLRVFLMSAFVKAIWGIGIQLVVVPLVVKTVEKSKGKENYNG